MRRLVESWIEAEKELYGINLAGAIRRMNEQRGFRLTHSRVSQWRRGVYKPSLLAVSEMLFRTIPWALSKAGIEVTKEQRHRLDGLLWIAAKEDGKQYVELL